MKYGLIGHRLLSPANIDFHSLLQLSVPLCSCLPLTFSLSFPCRLLFIWPSVFSSSLSCLHDSSIPGYTLKKRSIIQRRDGETQKSTRDTRQRKTKRCAIGGHSVSQRDKEEVKDRQQCGRRDRWGCRDEVKERQSRKQRERGRCNYLSGVWVCVTEEEAH